MHAPMPVSRVAGFRAGSGSEETHVRDTACTGRRSPLPSSSSWIGGTPKMPSMTGIAATFTAAPLRLSSRSRSVSSVHVSLCLCPAPSPRLFLETCVRQRHESFRRILACAFRLYIIVRVRKHAHLYSTVCLHGCAPSIFLLGREKVSSLLPAVHSTFGHSFFHAPSVLHALTLSLLSVIPPPRPRMRARCLCRRASLFCCGGHLPGMPSARAPEFRCQASL